MKDRLYVIWKLISHIIQQSHYEGLRLRRMGSAAARAEAAKEAQGR